MQFKDQQTYRGDNNLFVSFNNILVAANPLMSEASCDNISFMEWSLWNVNFIMWSAIPA